MKVQRIQLRQHNGLHFDYNPIIKIIKTGEQSKNFVIRNMQNQQEMWSFMKNDSYTQNRIDILLSIQDLQHVPKILNIINDVYIDVSPLVPNEYQHLGLYPDQSYIVIRYEYVTYPHIKKSTFSKGQDGPLTGENLIRCLNVFHNLCETVLKLHDRYIYHFDIKPENILADEKNFTLLDFGSSKYIKTSDPGVFCLFGPTIVVSRIQNSTVLFAPLQFAGPESNLRICMRYDVYSLGCVLYYLLTGRYLFKPLSPESVKTDPLLSSYSNGILDLVCGMTFMVPAFRYSLALILKYQYPKFQGMLHPAFSICSSEKYIMNEHSDDQRRFWMTTRQIFRGAIIRAMGRRHIRRNSVSGPQQYTLRPAKYQSKDDLALCPVLHCLKELQPVEIMRHENFSSLRSCVYTTHPQFNRKILVFNYVLGMEDYIDSLESNLGSKQFSRNLSNSIDTTCYNMDRSVSHQTSFCARGSMSSYVLERVSIEEDIVKQIQQPMSVFELTCSSDE